MTEIAKDRPAKGVIPEIPFKKLRQLWLTQRKTEEIATELQVSLPYLYTLAKRYNLPKRTHVKKTMRPRGSKEVDPTPEEIVARAAEVRARWTEQEYARNSCYKPQRAELKTFMFHNATTSFLETSRIN
jgi:electron transfer flavoprotein alpha/beta subunit